MTAVDRIAYLAIDPPSFAGRPRAATPCTILDAKLQPVLSTVADGTPKRVPAGRLLLLIWAPHGPPRRRLIELEPGLSYRLHYFPVAGRPHETVVDLADEEAVRAMAFLDSGRVMEARALVDHRLRDLREGRLGDPVAAVAVGYVLAQTWDREALAPWCLDLPHEYPWLADGYVIAAEWHALAGNHVTALNYLRRCLRAESLPVFSHGVSRALDRLAGYRGFAVDELPSHRLSDMSPDLRTFATGQLLNRWDVEDAEAAYWELARRAGRADLTAPVTAVLEQTSHPRLHVRAVNAFAQAVQRCARDVANHIGKEPMTWSKKRVRSPVG
jgi:hypothetical protein